MNSSNLRLALVLFSCQMPLLSAAESAAIIPPEPIPVVVPVAIDTVTATTDVEATMKQMSFRYKQAMGAADLGQFQGELRNLQQLVASVQAHQFAPEKQVIFQRGLAEVQVQLEQSLNQPDLTAAKAQLEKVTALKKQYHQQRSPSLWRLLFGG